MRSILLAALVLAAPVALAQSAATPEATMKKFSLVGRLAPDCSIPLGEEPLTYLARRDGTEGQVRFKTLKDGKVELLHFSISGRKAPIGKADDRGYSPRHLLIHTARQINANELQLSAAWDEAIPGGKPILQIVWEKKGGKLRMKSIFNEESQEYGVKDHVSLTGQEFQWLNVCGEG